MESTWKRLPTYFLHLSASYHHPGGLYGRLDVRNMGNIYYYDGSAQAMQKVDPYTLVNAKLGWLYGNWDVYAFVRNLLDEEYINAFKSSPMTGAAAGFGNPRAIGVGVSYTF